MWIQEGSPGELPTMALQLVRTARSLDQVGDLKHLMLRFLMEVVEPFLTLPARALVQWRFAKKAVVLPELIDCKARTFHQSTNHFQVASWDFTADIRKLKSLSKAGNRKKIPAQDALAKFLGGRLTPELVFEMLKKLRYDADTALFLFNWAEEQEGYKHQPRHYDFIVQVLASSKKFEDIDQVLRVLAANELYLGFEALQALVVSYANAGLVEKALDIFRQLRRRRFSLPTHVLNSLFSALEKERLHQQVYQITEELVAAGYVPRESTSDILLRCFCRSGSLDKAFWLLEVLAQSRSPVGPMAFSMVLDGLCKVGREDSAVRLFEEMVVASSVASTDRDFVCSSLICGIFRTGRLDRVSVIVRQLIQAGLAWRSSDFSFLEGDRLYDYVGIIELIQSVGCLNTFAYNCVIEGLCKAGKLEEAREVLGIMQRNSVPPDIFTYSSMIDVICKSGRIEEAEKLLEFLESSDNKPDVVTYTNMVTGFCQVGRFNHAFGMVARMKEQGCSPDLLTFNTIVSGLCQASEFEKALNVVVEMVTAGCEPDEIIYSTIIDALSEKEEWASTLKVFELMRRRNCPASVDLYGRLANCLCKAGAVEAASSLLQDMATGGSKSGLLLGGEPCKPNLVIYNAVISGFCERGRVDEALAILQVLKEADLQPDVLTYTSFILGFCRTWKMDEAFSVLQAMLKADCSPDATTYNTLILGLRTVGREEEAVGMLQVMVENGCEPDEFTFKILIETLCKTRKLEAALELLSYMKVMNYAPEMATFKNLVYGHYQAGKVKEAKQILQQESKAFSARNPGKSLVSELHEASNPSERLWLDVILRDGL